MKINWYTLGVCHSPTTILTEVGPRGKQRGGNKDNAIPSGYIWHHRKD